MLLRTVIALAACAGVFGTAAGCAPTAPRLGRPTRVEAFCGSKQARMTSVDSVMTSTDDTILNDRPTERDVRQAVTAGDGTIAHFDDLLLHIPKSAAALGERDGYARVRAVGVPPAPEGALSRHIYLLVRERGAQRWITMQAFDVQNVCVEGKRQS
ncbi:MAG: hypothetical protein NVS3B16_24580 [Vulcanimicrobiaceae bacterium]